MKNRHKDKDFANGMGLPRTKGGTGGFSWGALIMSDAGRLVAVPKKNPRKMEKTDMTGASPRRGAEWALAVGSARGYTRSADDEAVT
jgi:hypothetical protein